jgi:hypothetical protein
MDALAGETVISTSIFDDANPSRWRKGHLDPRMKTASAQVTSFAQPHSPAWKAHIGRMQNTPQLLKLGDKEETKKYRFEKADPQHRMGDVLQGIFDWYAQFVDKSPLAEANFYPWLLSRSMQEQKDLIKGMEPSISKPSSRVLLTGTKPLDEVTRWISEGAWPTQGKRVWRNTLNCLPPTTWKQSSPARASASG